LAKIIPIDEKDRIRLPGPSDRITIIGHTGSGKSQAAMWHLSNANFDVMPWVIVDPKEDDKINSIQGAEYIEHGYVPKYPGIYILPNTRYQIQELDDTFAAYLERRNVGVYIDEASECGFGPGFETFLTRGRSRRCPAIVLCQRPVNVSRYSFSEAQFFQCFPLTDERDYKTLRGFAKVPDMEKYPLPEFYSYYYDVRWKRCYRLTPVPKIDVILNRIENKMESLRVKPQSMRRL
jgi:hypothetical protein